MKKLINAVDDVVKEQLEGMAAAHSNALKVHFEPSYVYRADAPIAGKVALISGGGSGHEPMHGGFVLNEPNIQVFERKPKEPKPEATT